MSLDSIRQGVVTAITQRATLFSTYSLTIEFDNIITVDTKTQTNPFLQVRILMLAGDQIDLSDDPTHRIIGQIHLAAAVKQGDGSKKASELLEFFYPYLQKKSLGGVRTYMSSFSTPQTLHGWVYTPVLIPFWYDTKYGV